MGDGNIVDIQWLGEAKVVRKDKVNQPVSLEHVSQKAPEHLASQWQEYLDKYPQNPDREVLKRYVSLAEFAEMSPTAAFWEKFRDLVLSSVKHRIDDPVARHEDNYFWWKNIHHEPPGTDPGFAESLIFPPGELKSWIIDTERTLHDERVDVYTKARLLAEIYECIGADEAEAVNPKWFAGEAEELSKTIMEVLPRYPEEFHMFNPENSLRIDKEDATRPDKAQPELTPAGRAMVAIGDLVQMSEYIRED